VHQPIVLAHQLVHNGGVSYLGLIEEMVSFYSARGTIGHGISPFDCEVWVSSYESRNAFF
jgi:hypothetical protein